MVKRRNYELDLPSFTLSQGASEDIPIQKQIKHGKGGQAACAIFEEYCSNSTIHGAKYLGETKRHWLEKIWWIIAFVISLFCCGSLIRNVYDKWDQSPVIVTFSEKTTPVWEIPFPAVTICPEIKANKTMLNFTDIYHKLHDGLNSPHNISEKELKYMEAVSQVCDPHLTNNIEIGGDFTDKSIIDLLREVAPTFKETMYLCKFRNTIKYCSDLFEEVMTEEGLCFTFNVFNGRELYRDEISEEFFQIEHNMTSKWSLETGYDELKDVDTQTYPHRVFVSGTKGGLFVLLRLFKQNLEYICHGPVQGFKIVLHTPGEVPQVSKHYFRVPLLQEVMVSVKPHMTTTSEGLKNYPPHRRQCFFNSERELRFFKIYTQRNCELECLTNFTLSHCGCVKFSMPRDNKTPICGASKIGCYNQAEDNLLKKQFVDELSTDREITDKYASRKGCNCLPACTSITYDAEISQASYDWISLFNAYRTPLDEYASMQPARLSIFFKESQFITARRSELYGPTDFLANCGGILGLFMGISLLSIVELIYHMSLRLCCNLRNRISHRTGNKINSEPLLISDMMNNGSNEDSKL